MSTLIHEPILASAAKNPLAEALVHRKRSVSYTELALALEAFASSVLALGTGPGERVAVFLPKQPEAVIAIFGASLAGACFVPINPVLKPAQVAHIIADCQVKVLVTARQRWQQLQPALESTEDLQAVVVVDAHPDQLDGLDQGPASRSAPKLLSWYAMTSSAHRVAPVGHRRIDRDIAAILYTSGSTGRPKGVVLSHRNMLAGSESVAAYLENTHHDRILAVLPLSFDAGLSQLTTAFLVGATAVIMDYLLPRDVLRAVVEHRITGLAAVPPLWNQLVQLDWPDEAADTLRYITNTGGAMPVATTRALRQRLPGTAIFLMYGLTEAFRSTYLPPEQVDQRPESIGKAIPNADILVVRPDGTPCDANEPGELVHRGALVALGYWNDPAKTAERFRPCPGQDPALPITEYAVWSGDQVRRDEDGFLYFVARKDDMIKTSGYRVSPSEVEEVAFATGLVAGAVALGLRHEILGQAILLIVSAADADNEATVQSLIDALRAAYARELPNFMQPKDIIVCASLPQNQNGKIDRPAMAAQYAEHFVAASGGT